MASTDAPIFIKAANAAMLGDMSVRKFRYLLSDRKLPPPVKIEGLVRWDRQVLVDALRELAEPANRKAIEK